MILRLVDLGFLVPGFLFVVLLSLGLGASLRLLVGGSLALDGLLHIFLALGGWLLSLLSSGLLSLARLLAGILSWLLALGLLGLLGFLGGLLLLCLGFLHHCGGLVRGGDVKALVSATLDLAAETAAESESRSVLLISLNVTRLLGRDFLESHKELLVVCLGEFPLDALPHLLARGPFAFVQGCEGNSDHVGV